MTRTSVRVLASAAQGRQVGYCTVRKADASDVVAYVAQLEQRVCQLTADRDALRAELAVQLAGDSALHVAIAELAAELTLEPEAGVTD